VPEYRIRFSIELVDDEDDGTEIGFGVSGAWPTVDAAMYAVESDIGNRQWETRPGMPDPSEVDQ
jgi:hypothetical protein